MINQLTKHLKTYLSTPVNHPTVNPTITYIWVNDTPVNHIKRFIEKVQSLFVFLWISSLTSTSKTSRICLKRSLLLTFLHSRTKTWPNWYKKRQRKRTQAEICMLISNICIKFLRGATTSEVAQLSSHIFSVSSTSSVLTPFRCIKHSLSCIIS